MLQKHFFPFPSSENQSKVRFDRRHFRLTPCAIRPWAQSISFLHGRDRRAQLVKCTVFMGFFTSEKSLTLRPFCTHFHTMERTEWEGRDASPSRVFHFCWFNRNALLSCDDQTKLCRTKKRRGRRNVRLGWDLDKELGA